MMKINMELLNVGIQTYNNNQHKNKITKVPVGVSIDIKRLDEIDEIRGDVPRSVFIMKMVNMMFQNHKQEVNEYVEANRVNLE